MRIQRITSNFSNINTNKATFQKNTAFTPKINMSYIKDTVSFGKNNASKSEDISAPITNQKGIIAEEEPKMPQALNEAREKTRYFEELGHRYFTNYPNTYLVAIDESFNAIRTENNKFTIEDSGFDEGFKENSTAKTLTRAEYDVVTGSGNSVDSHLQRIVTKFNPYMVSQRNEEVRIDEETINCGQGSLLQNEGLNIPYIVQKNNGNVVKTYDIYGNVKDYTQAVKERIKLFNSAKKEWEASKERALPIIEEYREREERIKEMRLEASLRKDTAADKASEDNSSPCNKGRLEDGILSYVIESCNFDKPFERDDACKYKNRALYEINRLYTVSVKYNPYKFPINNGEHPEITDIHYTYDGHLAGIADYYSDGTCKIYNCNKNGDLTYHAQAKRKWAKPQVSRRINNGKCYSNVSETLQDPIKYLANP